MAGWVTKTQIEMISFSGISKRRNFPGKEKEETGMLKNEENEFSH